MTRDRGHRNTNERGSSWARRERKLFLLDKFGNGIIAWCWECGTQVALATIYVDRIVPAHEGGTYARHNIRPHCCTCSCRQGQRLRIALYRKEECGDC